MYRQHAFGLNVRGMSDSKAVKKQKLGAKTAKCRRKAKVRGSDLKQMVESSGTAHDARLNTRLLDVSKLQGLSSTARSVDTDVAMFSWGECLSVDLSWVLSRMIRAGTSGVVRVEAGSTIRTIGTCWQSIRRKYGKSTVRVDGKDEFELGSNVSGKRCQGDLLEIVRRGGEFWTCVEKMEGFDGQTVKQLNMKWSKKGSEVLVGWSNCITCWGLQRFVCSRVQHAIRSLGGKVAPKVVIFRVQSGYRVVRRDVRRAWHRLVEDEWSRLGASRGMI